ncbi:hypothetical protein ACFC0C_13055 [Streptomyces sp. NPDC056178]|uniref:hypothetical protein n=1 Tax=unclassified Streptomyces TaxID=2593676 RepID=UPI0035E0F644
MRLIEPLPGGLRHAFWPTPDDHGRERHEFYGFAVPASGTAAGVFCTHEDPADLAWAQHVWRFLDRTGPS